MKKLLCASLLILPFAGFSYELEIGAGVEAMRTAYKDYRTEWAVSPIVDFENDDFYLRDFSAGFKFLTLKDEKDFPFLSASAFASYDYFTFDPKHAKAGPLRQLKERSESIYGGIRFSNAISVGLIEVSAAREVLGHGEGTEAAVVYHLPIDMDVVELIPRIGLVWNDRKYNRYYYGISQNEAIESGLPAYCPEASLSPLAGLAVYVPIEEQWEILVNAEVEWVPETVQDSPMTEHPAILTVGAALYYIF